MEKGVTDVEREKNNLFCSVGLELDIHICTEGAVQEGVLTYIDRVFQKVSLFNYV